MNGGNTERDSSGSKTTTGLFGRRHRAARGEIQTLEPNCIETLARHIDQVGQLPHGNEQEDWVAHYQQTHGLRG